MAISESSRAKLSWLLLESFLVVASILLAFWIDAWWDQRKDRIKEYEILIGLEAEFVDVKTRLEYWASRNARGIGGIGKFLSGVDPETDRRAVEYAFESASIANILDRGGAVDALIFSGRLEQIGDRDLRTLLIKWPDWIDDIASNDLSARRFAMDQIQPYLARHGFPGVDCPEGRLVCAEPGPVPTAYLALAADPEFRALLMLRRNWLRGAVRDHNNAANQAEEILSLIRKRLETIAD
ncbi:MAG: hypothetical protein GTO71_09700 [Woeseiaceae bacterium]|nr:hypothetical protein [Woeseiaceae bacterium]NIP21359.1 hypothetical protein [Woeseiaceae bacterium]NIS90326.1 hypothetical protein [Woeseiaceae bacterium]